MAIISSMDFYPAKWSNYIRTKFVEWRGDTRSSLSDFAQYVGVSPQVMSNWYLGKLKKRPSSETYIHLVNLFGQEVYEALDLPQSEPVSFEHLPSDMRDRLKAAMLEIGNLLNERSLDTESPEAEELSRQILSKYGFIVKSTHKSG